MFDCLSPQLTKDTYTDNVEEFVQEIAVGNVKNPFLSKNGVLFTKFPLDTCQHSLKVIARGQLVSHKTINLTANKLEFHICQYNSSVLLPSFVQEHALVGVLNALQF